MGCNYRLRGDRHKAGVLRDVGSEKAQVGRGPWRPGGGGHGAGVKEPAVEEETLCPGDGAPGRLVGCQGTYGAGAVSEGRGASEKEQMMNVWTPGWAVRGTS